MPANHTPPPVGTYPIRQTGTITIGTSKENLPSSSILAIAPTNSPDQQIWHQYQNPKQPASEDETLNFRPDGVFLQSVTFHFTTSGLTFNLGPCNFSQQLASPTLPVAVGQSYTGAATCGAVTLQARSTVDAERQVTLNGNTYPVFVITTIITTHGTLAAHVTAINWYSPELRLPLHIEAHASGVLGVVAFSTDIVADLQSAHPNRG